MTILAPSTYFQLFQDFCAGLMTCLVRRGVTLISTMVKCRFKVLKHIYLFDWPCDNQSW